MEDAIDDQWCLVEGILDNDDSIQLCFVAEKSPKCISIKDKSITKYHHI